MFLFFWGCFAFLFFALSDINDYYLFRKELRFCYPFGILVLSSQTLTQIIINIQAGRAFKLGMSGSILFGMLGFVFFGVTIYALFFALPAKQSYLMPGQIRETCSKGLYALCRHPAVVSFSFMYICFSLCFGYSFLYTGTYTILNILLSLFEDKYIFRKNLKGYEEYKKKTPFILPTASSIKNWLEMRV